MKLTIKALASVAIIIVMMVGQSFTSGSKPAKYQEAKIKVSAVCDMCKETLEKAMTFESGVKKSNLDVATKIFTVVYNPKKTNVEKIKKAISMVGYDADDVARDKAAFDKLHECCKTSCN